MSRFMQSRSATPLLRIERRIDLRLQLANLALQRLDAGARGTAFGVQRIGLGAGDLLALQCLGCLLYTSDAADDLRGV